MAKGHFEVASDLQNRVALSENSELAAKGIAPVSQEAVPHYAAWTRSDLVMVVSLLTSIAGYLRTISITLAIIAVMVFFYTAHKF